MGDPRQDLALHGERLAESYLCKQGFKTLARRFRTPVGELDLVMRERDTIVFVEVKTRRDRVFADPQDALNAGKWRRLTRAARWFLRRRGLEQRPCRFDAVAIVMPPDGPAEIEHTPAAHVPPDR